jgi:hypothetical protein
MQGLQGQGAPMTSAVTEWLALRRVHEGGVTQLTTSEQFLDRGRPVAGYLAEALGQLIGSGHLTLGAGDPDRSQRQVCVTHEGQRRYAELSGTQARCGR